MACLAFAVRTSDDEALGVAGTPQIDLARSLPAGERPRIRHKLPLRRIVLRLWFKLSQNIFLALSVFAEDLMNL